MCNCYLIQTCYSGRPKPVFWCTVANIWLQNTIFSPMWGELCFSINVNYHDLLVSRSSQKESRPILDPHCQHFCPRVHVMLPTKPSISQQAFRLWYLFSNTFTTLFWKIVFYLNSNFATQRASHNVLLTCKMYDYYFSEMSFCKKCLCSNSGPHTYHYDVCTTESYAQSSRPIKCPCIQCFFNT